MSARDREAIAAKIRALRAKTVENGCTEAEALAAAAKVAKMLADYNMTLDEAELRASPFGRHDERHEDDVGRRLWRVASAIEDLTGARTWTEAPGVLPYEVHFFGLAHEVDVAAYLLEICARAMRTERDRIVAANAILRPAKVRNLVNPFLDGMADRLAERIRDLIPPTPTGTGLMVLRGQLVDAAMAEAGIALRPSTARHGQGGGLEYLQGRLAGDGVALNPGLCCEAPAAAIGGRR